MESDSESRSNSSMKSASKSPKNSDVNSDFKESNSENDEDIPQNKASKSVDDDSESIEIDDENEDDVLSKADDNKLHNGGNSESEYRQTDSQPKNVQTPKLSNPPSSSKAAPDSPVVEEPDSTGEVSSTCLPDSVPTKTDNTGVDDKMVVDPAPVLGIEASSTSDAITSQADDEQQCKTIDSSDKDECSKMDVDPSVEGENHVGSSQDVSRKKSLAHDRKSSQRKKSEPAGESSKSSQARTSRDNPGSSKDKPENDSGDAEDADERSNQKDKNTGIDAIAKKLGLQIQVSSENNKEPAEEGKEDSTAAQTKPKVTVKESVASTSKSKASTSEKPEGKSSEKKKKKKRTCEECAVTKGLKFQVLYQGKMRYLCSDVCFKNFKEKQTAAKSNSAPAKSTSSGSAAPQKPLVPDVCAQCKKVMKDGKGYFSMVGAAKPLCSIDCLINYQEYNIPKKKCSQCKVVMEDEMSSLSWETMEFCNEDCLGKFQSYLGSHCTCCQSPVQQTSLGKYCVCFGADIRQFCSGTCLEEFKKGLKVCSFCQKDLSTGPDGFLAPVGDKGQFKDFCSQPCMERYEVMNTRNNAPPQTEHCSFCNKTGIFKIHVTHGEKSAVLCCDNCVAGYRYNNKISLKVCDTCYKFFEPEVDNEFQLQFEGVNRFYCTKACMTLFVLSNRKIIPCSWCRVKKYNFDMIEKLDSSHQMQTYCSLNCISLFRVSLSATSAKSIRCDNCTKTLPAQFHLTMSDGSIRNFCTYPCVVQFQNQFTNAPALTTSTPTTRQNANTAPSTSVKTTSASLTPVISNVVSLASANPRSPSIGIAKLMNPQKVMPHSSTITRPSHPSITILTSKSQTPAQTATTSVSSSTSTVNSSSGSTHIVREVIVKPPQPKSVKNKAVLCKPIMQTKAISCKPFPCHKAVQTEEGHVPTIIPIPVPVYVPTPVHMFSRPVPCPVPFPVPIPVPIFVPLSKDAPNRVIKQLQDIQEKIPSNPFEAEMLMMAEMVAENDDKVAKATNDEIVNDEDKIEETPQPPANEESEVHLDVETELPPGIAPVLQKEPDNSLDDDIEYLPKEGRQPGKRTVSGRGRGRGKRARMDAHSSEDSDNFPSMPHLDDQNMAHQSDASDTNLRLKHTFGINAWKHWVLQKNSQLEKGSQSSRKFKLFKTDLLQLPHDELNYSLCLFVKEVRKPSGEEYAPASIYYLCLGIQQYLFENGRIDNIFTDPYYEKFTECLNDILLNQVELMSSEGFFISRIEEEILWESKQLGAHSPHVLLNTLMFFNTKYFNLKAIDDHSHLSFSHITKHWRKSTIKPTPRGVVLRYYPPLNKVHVPVPTLDWQRRRKEENNVYEQIENPDNPLRCPVKLYEFYMSKCPESVKMRNDMFYLYPERSCVPDSPVWYSTQPLGREMIAKMMQRIKAVREIYET